MDVPSATTEASPHAQTAVPIPGRTAVPVPRMLTPADDGRAFTMAVGQTTGLVVPDPYAPEPRIEGESVEVVAVVNVAASGRREWELRAVAAGRTTLTGRGSHPYVITLDVADP